MKFKPGDVVKHKGSGQKMVVLREPKHTDNKDYGITYVYCNYQKKEGYYDTQSFPTESLDRVEVCDEK